MLEDLLIANITEKLIKNNVSEKSPKKAPDGNKGVNVIKTNKKAAH